VRKIFKEKDDYIGSVPMAVWSVSDNSFPLDFGLWRWWPVVSVADLPSTKWKGERSRYVIL